MDTAAEGLKEDSGKLRFDLLPPDALEELARVYTVSLAKYPERNWEKGIRYGKIFGAACRHLLRWWRGEENDPEDGISHMAHAAWNCMTLLAFSLRRKHEFDDRAKLDGAEKIA